MKKYFFPCTKTLFTKFNFPCYTATVYENYNKKKTVTNFRINSDTKLKQKNVSKLSYFENTGSPENDKLAANV